MSKFCIELEGMMLPDAIAAVVEAWYDAQNVESAADWVEELRLQIKREFGRGWSVRGVGATKLNPDGRCQLTRIAPDRSRTSAVIPIEWKKENKEEIWVYVSHICESIQNGTQETLQSALESEMDFERNYNATKKRLGAIF